MEHIRFFEHEVDAIAAQDLLSPNATFIFDTNKVLTIDCGEDVPIEIVNIGGQTIIRKKGGTTIFTLDQSQLDINRLG